MRLPGEPVGPTEMLAEPRLPLMRTHSAGLSTDRAERSALATTTPPQCLIWSERPAPLSPHHRLALAPGTAGPENRASRDAEVTRGLQCVCPGGAAVAFGGTCSNSTTWYFIMAVNGVIIRKVSIHYVVHLNISILTILQLKIIMKMKL